MMSRSVRRGVVGSACLVLGAVPLMAPTSADGGAAAPLQDETTRVSVDSAGVEGNRGSGIWTDSYVVSGNGRYVAFDSRATNLVGTDDNKSQDVFRHDRVTGQTVRVSRPFKKPGAARSYVGGISSNGRWVVFTSAAKNLVPGDTGRDTDVFVRDLVRGKTSLVSVDSLGRRANGSSLNAQADVSDNGRWVAFASNARNLVRNDTNKRTDVFLRDRKRGTTTRVSVSGSGAQSKQASTHPSISGNGRLIAFDSDGDNLVRRDRNQRTDVFTHDRTTDKTRRVSLKTNGKQFHLDSIRPDLSENGKHVAFMLGEYQRSDGYFRIAVRSVVARATSIIAPDDGDTDPHYIGYNYDPSISANGKYVVFAFDDPTLGGPDGSSVDGLITNLSTEVTREVALDSNGDPFERDPNPPVISADGQWVVFSSADPDVVPGDTNDAWDVFVRHR